MTITTPKIGPVAGGTGRRSRPGAAAVAAREAAAIQFIRERLSTKSGWSAADVNAAVDRALRAFADAPVRDFVPLLVERIARTELGGTRHLTR